MRIEVCRFYVFIEIKEVPGPRIGVEKFIVGEFLQIAGIIASSFTITRSFNTSSLQLSIVRVGADPKLIASIHSRLSFPILCTLIEQAYRTFAFLTLRYPKLPIIKPGAHRSHQQISQHLPEQLHLLQHQRYLRSHSHSLKQSLKRSLKQRQRYPSQ